MAKRSYPSVPLNLFPTFDAPSAAKHPKISQQWYSPYENQSMKLPEGYFEKNKQKYIRKSLSLSKTYHCTLCDLTIYDNMHQVYLHLINTIHIQKYYVAENTTDSLDPVKNFSKRRKMLPAPNNGRSFILYDPLISPKYKQWYCETCKGTYSFGGKTQHLRGLKHLRNFHRLEMVETSLNLPPVSQKVSLMEDTKGSMEQEPQPISSPNNTPGKDPELSSVIKPYSEGSNTPIVSPTMNNPFQMRCGQEFISLISGTMSEKTWYCQLCDVKFHSPPEEIHLNGRQHYQNFLAHTLKNPIPQTMTKKSVTSPEEITTTKSEQYPKLLYFFKTANSQRLERHPRVPVLRGPHGIHKKRPTNYLSNLVMPYLPCYPLSKQGIASLKNLQKLNYLSLKRISRPYSESWINQCQICKVNFTGDDSEVFAHISSDAHALNFKAMPENSDLIIPTQARNFMKYLMRTNHLILIQKAKEISQEDSLTNQLDTNYPNQSQVKKELEEEPNPTTKDPFSPEGRETLWEKLETLERVKKFKRRNFFQSPSPAIKTKSPTPEERIPTPSNSPNLDNTLAQELKKLTFPEKSDKNKYLSPSKITETSPDVPSRTLFQIPDILDSEVDNLNSLTPNTWTLLRNKTEAAQFLLESETLKLSLHEQKLVESLKMFFENSEAITLLNENFPNMLNKCLICNTFYTGTQLDQFAHAMTGSHISTFMKVLKPPYPVLEEAIVTTRKLIYARIKDRYTKVALTKVAANTSDPPEISRKIVNRPITPSTTESQFCAISLPQGMDSIKFPEYHLMRIPSGNPKNEGKDDSPSPPPQPTRMFNYKRIKIEPEEEEMTNIPLVQNKDIHNN